MNWNCVGEWQPEKLVTLVPRKLGELLHRIYENERSAGAVLLTT
jgi:hypothetical protein